MGGRDERVSISSDLAAAVKESFQTEEGSRLKFLLESFIDHLHDYTREIGLTHEEWIGVLNFLYDCGKISTPERHEFILLSDVLGFSALVDMINTKGGATEGSNLGPFYLENAPRKSAGRRPVGRARRRHGAGPRQGDRYPAQPAARRDDRHLAGRRDRDLPDPGAGAGPGQVRPARHLHRRRQGRYWYTTVLPKPYTVPYDGPVGRLLRAGNRHAWRAAHLHFIIRAPGMQAITTEVFFDKTEYIDNDAVFGVRKSLIAAIEPARKAVDLGKPTQKTPDAVCKFDFVLAPAG